VTFQLEYLDQKLYLNIDKKLPNSIKFQIEYFGFKPHNDKNLKYVNINNDFNLGEIIEFFNTNNIDILLCSNTKKILDEQKNKINIFDEKISKLKQTKENFENQEFKKFCDKINYLDRPLKKHQEKSLYHLYTAGSAANFSVPGSGKTSVVLAFYENLKLNNDVDAIFLIGPKNCYYSWKTEFKLNLNRDPKLKILDENKHQRQIVYENSYINEIYACHFSTVANDINLLKLFLNKKKFLIVIDEAHNIKKIGGLWSRAILELKNFSKYKIILTGTPMPQDFKDFYNYLDFLYPDIEIINSHEKAQIEVFMDNERFDDAANLINEKIYPFYTRVTKKELGLAKPNFIKPHLITMNPVEKKIHDAITTKIKFYSKNDYLKNIELIKKIQRARIIRLRQTCSYVKNLITAIPADLRKGDENLLGDQDLKNLIASYDLNEKPAKIYKLKELCKEFINNGEKVLIWSTHLKTIDLIVRELSIDGFKIKKITGKTKLDEREKIKDEFNNKSSSLEVLVAIPQACSESISLHKACHNAVYYDMNYNTSEFLQSLDRIHRVGGSEKNPVFYHFLQYENSIDAKIYERVFEKADRQMRVIEEDNLTFSHPDNEDWDDLYTDLDL
jgi:SNF2 family DNA or RNA helicase